MQSFLIAAVVGLLTVIFSSLLKKQNPEFSVLLSLMACVVIALILLKLAEPVITFMERLRSFSGIDKELLTPLLKTIGIGILTQISSNVCSDAGENAIAKLIEICGGLLSIYVALPLLEAVLDMMQMMGDGA